LGDLKRLPVVLPNEQALIESFYFVLFLQVYMTCCKKATILHGFFAKKKAQITDSLGFQKTLNVTKE